MRLYGEGEHGSAGGPPGDLYVVVHVQEHSFFHREEDDLFCEMPISFPTLALGGTINVPTLDGREQVHVPSGTQPGTRFKIRGKGMINGETPDRHGWLTFVYPGEPLQPIATTGTSRAGL